MAGPRVRPGGGRPRRTVNAPDLAMPLAGRRILLTRDEEDCTAWAAEIEDLGAVPLVFPCIVCRDIDTPELRARLAAEMPRARWLAFTSRRGVASFARLRAGGRGVRHRVGRRRRTGRRTAGRAPRWGGIAAVGPATARAAADALGRVDLAGGAGGTARSLAEALVPRLGIGDRVLLAVAENAGRPSRRPSAPPGATCHRLDVYRTLPVPERTSKRAVSTLGADDVLLASPSAVAGFVNQVRLDRAPGIFTIGPSTTEAARAAGLDVTGEASRPGLRGLLEAMRCAT